MKCSSFAQISAIDVIEDLAVTLSSSSAGLTEIAFAEAGTSKFNKAKYLSVLDAPQVEDLIAKNCNVAFLTDCQGIDAHLDMQVFRQANNKSIHKKGVISFDVDFKAMKSSMDGKFDNQSNATSIVEKIIPRVEAYAIPVWLIVFSGHGIHFHFKLSNQIEVENQAVYQQLYKHWIDLLLLILGQDLVFDTSCCNLARLMRLPLSTNWKDRAQPVKTQVLYHNRDADASRFFRQLSLLHEGKRRPQGLANLTLEKILSYFEYNKMDSIKQSGEQLICSSPFGADATPSFYCHPGKKIFYDFSTTTGGNFYQLIAILSGKREFKEIDALARKIAAKRTTIEEGGRYSLREDGVWFSKAIDEGEECTWICSPLVIEAMTRDQASGAWGRVLGFYDQDQKYKTWAMPMELLAGEGLELRKELLARGLRISPNSKARRHLLEYIESCLPGERARCIDRIGWQGNAFVLPAQAFLPTSEGEAVVLQKEGDFSAFQTKGTLEEWQECVATPCKGNSRLVFVLAAAFAPPLLHLIGEESGGIHLTGASSIGKTMALQVAGSVWGGGGVNGFVRKWRATVNALESLAESRCDSLLVLDEIAEISAKDAAQATYMLANGCGKKRLNREGVPRVSAEWRILFLSSGEVGLGGHLAEAGETHRGGQFVRLVEIDADAGKGLGLFDTLGAFDKASALADELRRSCVNFYGTPIHAYLEKLVKMQNKEEVIGEIIRDWLTADTTGGLSAQLMRVAKRFALIAASGVLAARMGVLPFEEKEILEAVYTCFKSWALLHSDHPDFETARILSQIRQYLQANGCSQFPEWDGRATANFSGKCSGYRLISKSGDVEWLILNEVFRSDVCRGVDSRKAARVLKDLDMLKAGGGGKNSIPMRLPHFGLTRVYHLKANIFENGEFTGVERGLEDSAEEAPSGEAPGRGERVVHL